MFRRVRFVQLGYRMTGAGSFSSRTLFAPMLAQILELRCVGHKMLGLGSREMVAFRLQFKIEN
jgi:hypothetical protein